MRAHVPRATRFVTRLALISYEMLIIMLLRTFEPRSYTQFISNGFLESWALSDTVRRTKI